MMVVFRFTIREIVVDDLNHTLQSWIWLNVILGHVGKSTRSEDILVVLLYGGYVVLRPDGELPLHVTDIIRNRRSIHFHSIKPHVEVQDLAQLDYKETVIFQNVHNFCAQSTVLSPPQD